MKEYTIEDLIKAIKSLGHEIDKDTFMKLVNEKVKELNGLISDEAAALLVAKSMGVNVVDILKEIRERRYEKRELLTGLKKVRLSGIVKFVTPIRRIIINNNLRNFIVIYLVDPQEREIKAYIWDKAVDKAFKISKGDKIVITNASIRRGGERPIVDVWSGEIKVLGKEEIEPETIKGHILDLYEPFYNDNAYELVALININNSTARLLLVSNLITQEDIGVEIRLSNVYKEITSSGNVQILTNSESKVEKFERKEVKHAIVNVAEAYEIVDKYGASFLNIMGEVLRYKKILFLCSNNLCIPLLTGKLEINVEGAVILKGLLTYRDSKSELVARFDRYSGISTIDKKRHFSKYIKFYNKKRYFVYVESPTIKDIDVLLKCPRCDAPITYGTQTCYSCGYSGEFKKKLLLNMMTADGFKIRVHGLNAEKIIGYNTEALEEALEYGINHMIIPHLNDIMKNKKYIFKCVYKDGVLRVLSTFIFNEEIIGEESWAEGKKEGKL